MNCELCGSGIRGEVQVVNIDGGVFRVCNNCSRLGTPARVPRQVGNKTSSSRGFGSSSSSPASRLPPRNQRSPPPPPSPGFSYDSEEMILREDYSKAIKNARELLGITQEELGRKINEKPSMISHLEVGSMKPEDVLAKKLEHFLKIELFVPVEDELATDSN
ncbi:MAG: multiprotein bridging factor aMBF1 [Rhabdochlamydiaceae bacterium]